MNNKDHYNFDPAIHQGYFNGQAIPSVTKILKATGYINYGSVNQAALQAAAKFGRAVHIASALDDKNNLNESTCHPLVMEYLEGWRNFRKTFPLSFFGIEQRLYSKKWMFDGGYDRIIILWKEKKIVADLKTGQEESWHALQTAGYKILIEENIPDLKIKERWTVYLNPDFPLGFKVSAHKSSSDEREFLTALRKVKNATTN